MVVTGHTSASAADGADAADAAEAAAAEAEAAEAAEAAAAAPGRSARPVSIRDVAAAAGVSYQTVSRVINGHPSVKGSTRELVLATISSLGFRPNRAARALAGGPIQAVTVLTANTTLYGQRSAIQGIEEAARAADFAVGIREME